MRKLLIVSFILSLSLIVLGSNLSQDFYNYRASQNATGMLNLIDQVKILPDFTKSATILTLLADAFTEYGLWGAPKDKKAVYFNDSIDYAKLALKMTPNDAYLNFVAGAAIGRLAQYKGIIQSLFMLGDFDNYINKAIKLDPKLYRAYVALAMRYRDTPWPFADFEKSEALFDKALSIDPQYVYGYYELAMLYVKWGKKTLARETFQKVISMPVEEEFEAQETQCKIEAKAWIDQN
jgi:tetratricopeptide (TPR) repeat protein